jgi:hypothetical protein
VNDIPPALDAVVLRALAKNPADRFTRAFDMERALDAAVTPNAARYPPAKAGRTSEWLIALALVLVILGLLAAALASTLGGGSREQSDNPTRAAILAFGPKSSPTATSTARVLQTLVATKSQPTATLSNLAANERSTATSTPQPSPTPEPPTATPTDSPTETPTALPTDVPTDVPTAIPTELLTATTEPRIVPINEIAPTEQSAVEPTTTQFGAADWQGGYYRGDATWYGRAWTAVYGAQSEYPAASLTVSLPAAPTTEATLTITGLDDEWAGSNPIVVSVNDVEIYSGNGPFQSWDGTGQGEQAEWTTAVFTVPTGVLQAGTNEIKVANQAPTATFGAPPYILLSDAQLEING